MKMKTKWEEMMEMRRYEGEDCLKRREPANIDLNEKREAREKRRRRASESASETRKLQKYNTNRLLVGL